MRFASSGLDDNTRLASVSCERFAVTLHKKGHPFATHGAPDDPFG